MAHLIDRDALLADIEDTIENSGCVNHEREIMDCIRYAPAAHVCKPDEIAALRAEVERYQRWVDDLQSGMYVNCVYCGHRYGPGETMPVSMADALKAHVETCPKHPMSALKSETAHLRAELAAMTAERDAMRERAQAAEKRCATIAALPSCNDCKDVNSCGKKSRLGDWTRINCPLWRGPVEGGEDKP